MESQVLHSIYSLERYLRHLRNRKKMCECHCIRTKYQTMHPLQAKHVAKRCFLRLGCFSWMTVAFQGPDNRKTNSHFWNQYLKKTWICKIGGITCMHITCSFYMWPWTTKPVLSRCIFSNSQYIVWVKIIDFPFMPKIIRTLSKDHVPWRYFVNLQS